jgi:hypothetical protein
MVAIDCTADTELVCALENDGGVEKSKQEGQLQGSPVKDITARLGRATKPSSHHPPLPLLLDFIRLPVTCSVLRTQPRIL